MLGSHAWLGLSLAHRLCLLFFVLGTRLPRDQFDALLDLWGYLCDRLFSRLDSTFTSAIDRLGVSLQRLWVVNNVGKGRMEAVDAFFKAHSKRLRPGDRDPCPDLDWTPWLSIRFVEVWSPCLVPHLFWACVRLRVGQRGGGVGGLAPTHMGRKPSNRQSTGHGGVPGRCLCVCVQEPDRHADFAYFFTPEWAGSVMLSLRNAVSVVFQHTPRPALLQFDVLRLQLEQLRVAACAYFPATAPLRCAPPLCKSERAVPGLSLFGVVSRAHARIASLEAEQVHTAAESAALQVLALVSQPTDEDHSCPPPPPTHTCSYAHSFLPVLEHHLTVP